MPGQTGKGEPGECCPGAGSHIEEEMDNGFECQGEAEEKPGARGALRSPSVRGLRCRWEPTAEAVDDHCTEFVFCDLLVIQWWLFVLGCLTDHRPCGQT